MPNLAKNQWETSQQYCYNDGITHRNADAATANATCHPLLEAAFGFVPKIGAPIHRLIKLAIPVVVITFSMLSPRCLNPILDIRELSPDQNLMKSQFRFSQFAPVKPPFTIIIRDFHGFSS